MKDVAIPQIIHDAVKKLCNEEQIQDFEIHLNQGNDKGAGFLGEICFLTITDKRTDRRLDVVVKKAFTSESIRSEHPIRATFLNEICFYTKIWPKLNQFQIASSFSGFNNIPKCYTCNSNDQSEMIIMENLKKIGFECVDKKTTLDAEHVKIICRTYGKYHGISFALRQRHPEEFKQLSGSLLDMYQKFMDGVHFRQALKGVCQKVVEVLVPGEDDEIIGKFKKYAENYTEIFEQSLKYKGRNSVITHGDCWSNNLMFKYNNQRQPIDIKLIDWQLLKEGTPVFDLSYCLYSGASKDILDNLDDYLRIYHDSLSKTIQELQGDPSEFPFEELKKDWKENIQFGLLMSLMLIKMKLTPDDDTVDLTDFEGGDDDFGEKFINVPCDMIEFGRRVRELLRHVNEINAL